MVRKLTAALMVLAIAATIVLAWMQRFQPSPDAPRRVRLAYAKRMLTATGGIVLCLVGAGVGAALVSRQAKREYREAAMHNLRNLVEGDEGQAAGDK